MSAMHRILLCIVLRIFCIDEIYGVIRKLSVMLNIGTQLFVFLEMLAVLGGRNSFHTYTTGLYFNIFSHER